MIFLERIPGLAAFPQFRFRYIPQKEALPLFAERFALLQSGLRLLVKGRHLDFALGAVVAAPHGGAVPKRIK